MTASKSRSWQMKFFDDKTGGALLSECRTYRYGLWRHFNENKPPRFVNFLMLNPSTADEISNDPTVERCERRARAWGYDGLMVTNLFAFRSTDPRVLPKLLDPVGPDNDHYILRDAQAAALVICAWGRDGGIKGRSARVCSMLRGAGVTLHALKVSEATGEPWHPLYLSYDLMPMEYVGRLDK